VRDTIRRLVEAGQKKQEIPQARGSGVWNGRSCKDGVGRKDDRVVEGRGGEARRPMTVIIITHAREMMAIAEHIVMLDKGRVVEQGGFLELKRKKGGAFGRLLRGEAE
jgi:ATP-binding cassette subfamily B (MDR/TAP) protein 1